MDIQEPVSELALARQIEAQCKADVADIQAELEASGLWKLLQERKAMLKAAQDAASAQYDYVRELGVTAYGETGNKKVHPAVTVKMYTTLAYDPADALEYAREHLHNALKLNKSAFEKVAKVADLDFVTIGQKPGATVAKDLSKYLDEQPEPA